jgi:hypothetical protein
MWVLVGASPTGPTNGQQNVKDFKAGNMGEELSAPSERGQFFVCHCYYWSARGAKKNSPC